MNLRNLQGLILATGLCVASSVNATGNPERNVYWGEQHVHTSLSFDAYAFGNTLTGPEQFYQYAIGEQIVHPGGFNVKITRPLDWGAVTEHTDFMGIVQQASDPDSPLRKSSKFLSRLLEKGTDADPLLSFKVLSASIATGHAIETFSNPAVLTPVWDRIIKAADTYYEPGRFTTFAAFEWTSTPDAKNLHRNIFFRDSAKVPAVPYTSIDSTDPRDLWAWMDKQRAAGNELLAVSHNGNLSSGNMYPRFVDHLGNAIDKSYAEARLRNEPLTEIKQVKGQSETTPGLSPNDEFANYEVFVWQLLGAKGAPQEYGSYVRQAYRDGLAMGQGMGFNPYKFGVVGGSDSHVTAVPYRQKNFFGVHGTVDDSVEKRMAGTEVLNLNSLWVTPAGLSAVWAEENTREAIFSGMQRKEAYSSTGVRITLRFFGGRDYESDMLQSTDWIKQAYAKGVPMGGDLPASTAADAPSFAVWAAKDPDAANLDRIQVVKGWSINGQSFEQVYDVAWAGDRKPDPDTGKVPAIGSTVDINNGTFTDTLGAAELKTVWTDPDFDPAIDAFYYVRVLEIPTPRWSTIQAAELGMPPPSGKGYTAVIQERAWSSPIWYTPDDKARAAAPKGLTVAQLEKQGAHALTGDELKKLVVGNTLAVHNRVSGRRFEILYGTEGRRVVTAVDGEPADMTDMAELMHGGNAHYEIENNHLTTDINGTPLEVAVYKLGDEYLAAKGDEYGFVNYEVRPVVD